MKCSSKLTSGFALFCVLFTPTPLHLLGQQSIASPAFAAAINLSDDYKVIRTLCTAR